MRNLENMNEIVVACWNSTNNILNFDVTIREACLYEHIEGTKYKTNSDEVVDIANILDSIIQIKLKGMIPRIIIYEFLDKKTVSIPKLEID